MCASAHSAAQSHYTRAIAAAARSLALNFLHHSFSLGFTITCVCILKNLFCAMCARERENVRAPFVTQSKFNSQKYTRHTLSCDVKRRAVKLLPLRVSFFRPHIKRSRRCGKLLCAAARSFSAHQGSRIGFRRRKRNPFSHEQHQQ